jgi:uncharacterized small protein (DUF1192 family)
MTCKAMTKKGEPCRATAGEGGMCYLHANPDKAKTLGQVGGRQNRRVEVLEMEVPETMSLHDLSRLNAQAMNLLLVGKIQPRVAAAFAQLSNGQMKVLNAAEVAGRLITLEEELAKLRADQSIEVHGNGVPPASTVIDVQPDDDIVVADPGEAIDEATATERAEVMAEPEYVDPSSPSPEAGDGGEGEADAEQ